MSARAETRDYVDIVELRTTYPLSAICWAACGKDPGFSPLSLLKMMRRFARIDEAEAKMTRVADEQPGLPIGVAFVDATGRPGWIGDNPALRPRGPSVRGCWPAVHGLEP